MFCINCGKAIKEGEAFCGGCGCPASGAAAPGPAQPPSGDQGAKSPRPWRKWLLWAVGGLLLLGLFNALTDVDLEAESRKLLRETLEESFADVGGDCARYVRVGAIESLTLVNEGGNIYNGLAEVTLKVAKGGGAKKKFRYDVKVTYDGENILLETKPLDEEAILAFLEDAGIDD